MRYFFIFMLLFSSLLTYSQKSREKIMMESGDKLLGYLGKNDTASIMRLFGEFYTEPLPKEEDYRKGLAYQLEDCRKYQMITKKYGVPKRTAYKIKDGINSNKELEIMLFDKKDTVLKMTYCKIVISFYPFSIMEPNFIYGYRIEDGFEKSNNNKIIPAPPIKNN